MTDTRTRTESVPASAVQGIRCGDWIETHGTPHKVAAVVRNLIHCTDGTTITRVRIRS